MRSYQAAVVLALGHYTLGPQMHSQVRPVVVALYQLVPNLLALFLPWFVLWHEAPEGGEVDDDAIVEVGVP